MASSEASRRTSKRVSTAPAHPKAPVSIDAAAIIANHAVLTGVYPIEIGPQVVIHQYAKVASGTGPIEIGEGSIIWEKAVVGNAAEDEAKESDDKGSITLGSNVIIETGAMIEAESIGDSTIVEAFAKIGKGAIIGKCCKILPYAVVLPHSNVPDFTVVMGTNETRLDTTMVRNPMLHETKAISHKKHLKVLQALIPSNLVKWQT